MICIMYLNKGEDKAREECCGQLQSAQDKGAKPLIAKA